MHLPGFFKRSQRLSVACLAIAFVVPTVFAAEAPKPLKALLITGGCCHDYAQQKDLLKMGLEARANVVVDQIHTDDRSTRARFAIYEKEDWAKGYDIIIHDECSADVKEMPYVQNILNAHKTIPAVNLHCAMHSYRTGTDDWFKFIGIQSSSHGPQEPIAVTYTNKEHPIAQTLSDWTTMREELYNNVKIFESATAIAKGKQKYKRRDGTEREEETVVAWVNNHGNTRVFSTTLGHNNGTVGDDRYLNLVARGMLWAAAKLDQPGYLKDHAAEEKKRREAEEKHRADIKVPEGFEATIFAGPPMANYPVFVAAAPDGTLFISSDGNGSLGRDPHRGRVLRLRDIDGDGRADESKEFVKDIDSPRGLVWDNDRLYLLHPPHVSVFIDKDGDGSADEQKVLVKNIAFTFKDRPADHSSNGLELGVDGWLYAAIGDFGFMEAEGTDGRKVQLRAGGVVRFRPDGTGLEIYSRGTRNILEVAVSPLLDLIARDNNNDGGGWDIRLHHTTGLAEHGYPSLFKNFGDEIIQPLADYGGGSGCGGAWIDEPGIPSEWNNAPFTADWGRNWVYHHALERNGATFKAGQKEFFGATRTTDLDVDAMSRIYIASWKGATFNWAGPDVGYIVRLSPKGYQPQRLPDFNRITEDQLIKGLESPSHRRRLEAQRALLRRGLNDGALAKLKTLVETADKPLATRVAGLFAIKQGLGKDSQTLLAHFAKDPSLREFAVRAAADRLEEVNEIAAEPVITALKDSEPRVRLQAAIAAARMQKPGHAAALAPLLGDADPVVQHTAVQAMKSLGHYEHTREGISKTGPEAACLAVLDNPAAPKAQRAGAIRALQGLHYPSVVSALIERLQRETQVERKKGLITTLCRLHTRDGEWKGDSWGTRPDTSGPYYQPETWSESPRILTALLGALNNSSGPEAAHLIAEFNRHKISSSEAINKVVQLASADPNLVPAAAGQLSRAENIPDAALPFLLAAATAEETGDVARSHAVMALAKSGKPDAVRASLIALQKLDSPKDKGTERERRLARDAFLNSEKLASQMSLLQQEAVTMSGSAIYADAALLRLSDRRNAPADVKAAATAALEQGWADAHRRAQILNAVRLVEFRPYREKVLSAMDDENQAVASAAREAARVLRLERNNNAAPDAQIATMKVEDVVRRVTRVRGDAKAGEQLFTQLACMNCHTVRQDEAPRGPFLGTIAATYKRPELAEAVLIPNKSIAQGFVGNRFVLADGEEHEGFVTLEAADTVTIRNVAAQEIKIPVKNIKEREKLEKSLMPEGLAAGLTIREFASLLDYLESLNAQK